MRGMVGMVGYAGFVVARAWVRVDVQGRSVRSAGAGRGTGPRQRLKGCDIRRHTITALGNLWRYSAITR